MKRTDSAGRIHIAHIVPNTVNGNTTTFLRPLPVGQAAVKWPFIDLIEALEKEFSTRQAVARVKKSGERAVLISISDRSTKETNLRLDELEELTHSAGLIPVGRVVQNQTRRNARFLLGKGKLGDLAVLSLQEGANVWIFDQDLSPSQERTLSAATDIKIIDRTQLILDIFAQRAQSRAGKIQVELAQLKYLMPRLVEKNTAMSRLTGGIGSRGPGETKLEINRRRARERINRLQKELHNVSSQRKRQKKQRQKKGFPVVSLVGYTNAGKSTLLNTLTQSNVSVKNQLFATLDPTSRKLFLSPGKEAILTDTVGFIRDLPHELIDAFKATLEELDDADLLVHVVDCSNPDFSQHIEAVERILSDLDLDHKDRLLVLNKTDLVNPGDAARWCRRFGALTISARDRSTMNGFLPEIENMVFGSGNEPSWRKKEPPFDGIPVAG